MPIMQGGQNKTKQARRGTTRSRSGCITCKIRHIKCGEEKPNCLRCVSTGRKCDGYSSETQLQHHHRLDLAYRRPVPGFGADCTIVLTPGSKQERQYLNTFFAQGAGCVGGIIHTDLWDRFIPQLIHNRPMIRHAVAALSASCLHKFCPVDSSNKRNGLLALRQYNKAINEFVDFTSKAHDQDFEILLAACILFICLEMVRGNQTQAANHLEGGLRLLQRYQAPSARPLDPGVFHFFNRLNNQLPYLGRTIVPLAQPSEYGEIDTEITRFEDLEQARYMNTRIHRRTIEFNANVTVDSNGDLTPEMQQEYDSILKMCSSWQTAMQNMIVDSAKKGKALDPRALLILDISHHTCTVYAKTCMSLSETAYDAHMAHWEGIIHAAEQILLLSIDLESTHSPLSKLFSIEAELIPMVAFAAAKCRDPVLRRRAVSVLSRHAKLESFWNMKVSLRIVQRAIEYEEVELVDLPVEERIPAAHQRLAIAYATPTDGGFQNPVPVFMMAKPQGAHGEINTWWEYLDW